MPTLELEPNMASIHPASSNMDKKKLKKSTPASRRAEQARVDLDMPQREDINSSQREGFSAPASAASAPSAPSAPSLSSLSSSTSASAPSAPSAPEGLYEVRVAVIGNVDSGKSTLVGVLTGGEMDDGRGSARLRVAVHQHEASSGRTSSASQHIVGFNEKREPVFQPAAQNASAAAKDKGWRHVVDNSKSIVNFTDLAGHQRYLKTTVAGLTGWFPHYALLIINSLAGITRMTKEHLSVVLALNIPFIVVVTKVDMCPENIFLATKQQLWKALKSSDVNKMPINIRSEKDVMTCLAAPPEKIAPVFFVSSVSGLNLDLLSNYLSGLRPRTLDLAKLMDGCDGKDQKDQKDHKDKEESKEEKKGVDEKKEKKESKESVHFDVDHTFSVPGAGLVVSGTLHTGVVKVNSRLLLGPFKDGAYKEVVVRSIQTNRVSVDVCKGEVSVCFAIRALKTKDPLVRTQIRRGMVLLDPSAEARAYRSFTAQVAVLHHASTISTKYQAVVHCGNVRQSASIEKIDGECLRNGDKALVRFKFMARGEFIRPGQMFLFREGTTKGVGRIVEVFERSLDESTLPLQQPLHPQTPKSALHPQQTPKPPQQQIRHPHPTPKSQPTVRVASVTTRP